MHIAKDIFQTCKVRISLTSFYILHFIVKILNISIIQFFSLTYEEYFFFKDIYYRQSVQEVEGESLCHQREFFIFLAIFVNMRRIHVLFYWIQSVSRPQESNFSSYVFIEWQENQEGFPFVLILKISTESKILDFYLITWKIKRKKGKAM